jgi:hypothetical protein
MPSFLSILSSYHPFWHLNCSLLLATGPGSNSLFLGWFNVLEMWVSDQSRYFLQAERTHFCIAADVSEVLTFARREELEGSA